MRSRTRGGAIRTRKTEARTIAIIRSTAEKDTPKSVRSYIGIEVITPIGSRSTSDYRSNQIAKFTENHFFCITFCTCSQSSKRIACVVTIVVFRRITYTLEVPPSELVFTSIFTPSVHFQTCPKGFSIPR